MHLYYEIIFMERTFR